MSVVTDALNTLIAIGGWIGAAEFIPCQPTC